MSRIDSRFPPLVAAVEAALNKTSTAFSVLGLIALFAYGYVVFAFHLTIDSELYAQNVGQIGDWFWQGRWVMGMLTSHFILPTTVVPVVSPFLMVLLTICGCWLILKKGFGYSSNTAVVAVGFAITVPTLAFTASFPNLAFGVGVAFLALASFATCSRANGLAALIIVVISATVAIAVYQTFVFALSALCVHQLLRRKDGDSFSPFMRACVGLLLGGALYFAGNSITRYMLDLKQTYIGNYIDVAGFVGDPVRRIAYSMRNVGDILWLSEEKIGLHSPWLAIGLATSSLLCLRHCRFSTVGAAIVRCCAVLVLLMIPVIADAVSSIGAPLRSGLYYPVVCLLLVAHGFELAGPKWRSALIGVIALAVIGNATIINRLYASSALSYQLDRDLAREVLTEVTKLNPAMVREQILRIEVVGRKFWPDTLIKPQRESFGASFFEWDGGNRYRVAMFFHLLGVLAVGALDTEQASVVDKALAMPAWPSPGWVSVENGIVLIKFSDYTRLQQELMCAAGIKKLCNALP